MQRNDRPSRNGSKSVGRRDDRKSGKSFSSDSRNEKRSPRGASTDSRGEKKSYSGSKTEDRSQKRSFSIGERKSYSKFSVRHKDKTAPDKARKADDLRGDDVRLNKYLAETGIASRRKADELIAAGYVKVNGETVSELGTIIKYSDFVTVKGDPVSVELTSIYIVLNKPKDFITTTSDEKDRKTVLDLVRKRARIYPVGRLDRNTTGTLLLTNDGELAHRLTHPKYGIEKVYTAKLDRPINSYDANKISQGIELEDGPTAPCEVVISPEDKTKVSIILMEGRNREVRRIFEALNYEVKQLDRKSFAGITCRNLGRGEYRNLDAKEILALKMLVGLR